MLGVYRQQVAGLDHAEARRRIGDVLTAGHGQRRSRRIGSDGEVQVDERPNGIRQQFFVRRQCAVAFDGQIPLRQRGAANQLAHEVGLEAAARKQRCLHRHHFELLMRARGGVDKYRDAIRPRGLTRLGRSDRDGPAGQRGR